jgi:hypothetical protein
MIIVELALQAAQGFPATLRLGMKPGLNLVRTADRGIRSALIDAIYHTLYPDSSRGSATAALATSRESKIALTLYGRDKNTYRLLREMESGATKLFKYDPEKQKYGVLSESSQEAAQYVRVQQQLPDEVSFERLFIYAAESMPSKGDAARSRSGAPLYSGAAEISPSAPGLRSAPPRAASLQAKPRGGTLAGRQPTLPPRDNSFGSSLNVTNALVQSEMALDLGGDDGAPAAKVESPAVRLQQLAKLRQELLNLQRGERAQAELDQLNARRFELTERAEGVVALRKQVEALEKETGPTEILNKIPPGFEERLRNLESLEAKYQADAQRTFDEVVYLEDQARAINVLPLPRDPYFMAGVAGSLAFFGLAIMIGRPVVALFNVLGVLVAVGAAFNWVSQLEGQERAGAKVLAAKDRQERLEKQRSLDTGATRRLMEELEIDSPAEMIQKLDAYNAIKKQHQQAAVALDQALLDPDLRRSEEEHRNIAKRIEVLEAEVLGAQGSSLSADTMERKVAAFERELKSAGIDVPPRQQVRGTGDLQALPTRQGTGDLKLTTDDLPESVPAVARVAQPRRNSSVLDFMPPEGGEALLRSPTLTNLPAWPPPGGEVSTDLPFQGRTPAPGQAPPRQGSLVGQPLRPPPARAPSVPGVRPPPTQPPRPVSVSAPPTQPPLRAPSITGTPTQPPLRAPSITGTPTQPPRPTNIVPRAATVPPQRQPTLPPTPVAPPKPVAPKPVAAPGAAALFDYGGGDIGGNDDDDEQGYGGGYGSGGGGGEKLAPHEPFLEASGLGGGSGFRGAGGYGEDAAPPPDRSRDLVQAGVDLLQMDVDGLAQVLGPRIGQYLTALTDKKYRGAKFGPRGEVEVFEDPAGPKTGYMELEGEVLDLVDVSLRFALVEAILRKVRVPLLIDDPFTHLPGKNRRLFTQMIGYLGSATQLVIGTELEDLTGHDLKW